MRELLVGLAIGTEGIADSIFSRYNVCAEENLRDAMEKVTTYNEAESKEVVQMGTSR